MRKGKRMNAGIIAVIVICSVIVAVLLVAVIWYAVLCSINPNKDRPETIDSPTGYVQAAGTNLYDGDGKIMTLNGVNLGDWFVQENWMALSSVGDFETGSYTQQRGLDAMHANPNLTDEQTAKLQDIYMDNFITESDFETIAGLGLNMVRIPFTYRNIADNEANTSDYSFRYLDWAVQMCEKHGLYAILDLHGAYGSQNMDQHSGDDSQFNLYGNGENEAKTVKLWQAIAERYKDNKTVAAYDLLNEPRRAAHKYGGKVNFDFYDVLYQAVREIDDHHLIMIECFSFPVNGARLSHYDWTNICMEYHIYNHTIFSEKMVCDFYKALHNFMGYNTPVYIGEFDVFTTDEEWEVALDYFDNLGWSWSSWTYKANRFMYKTRKDNYNRWGIYELDMEPVDLYTATYDEIAAVYSSVGTANAEQTGIYDIYRNHFGLV